ncbi:helix-turn-helix domain-containing protein [Streptomyces uncialis]|uniref:XRE family transcriptional regulator n=1 Tax=Streptomyces uncialis TaxID=1048205 RepID=A0A1Q4V117_9ACTN|nr:helix-turn-helix transcriptional regulator [Streptomyces uncialis]OKH91523.1 XRE family transcriptional regulator [Streptomyces uncialis]
MVASHVGQRVRQLRKLRHLSVRSLATQAAISPSLLEKIESGDRTLSPALLTRIASVLRVGPDRLTGQPYMNGAEAEDPVQAVIPELRRICLTYDSPDDLLVAPRPLPVLAAEMEQLSRMRQDGKYIPMGALLPGLLSELTHVALAGRGEEQRRAFGWLARGYRATNSLAHKLGYHDLSLTAVERVHWAADRAGEPLMQVTAAYLKAGAMLRLGSFGSARRLLEGLEREIERMAPEGSMSEAELAVQGAVLLKLAMVEARDGQADRAVLRLAEAQAAAAVLRRDTTHYEMSFGPTNVRIHEIAMLIDTGDTGRALARLREWGAEQDRDEWELPDDLAAERASHHHIDVAAARLAEGDRGGAFADLAVARRISPAHTRFHPTVRHTAGALVRLDRSGDEAVTNFAAWAGV